MAQVNLEIISVSSIKEPRYHVPNQADTGVLVLFRGFHGFKRLLQVRNNVVDVFRADGQANRVLRNALIRQLFVRQLGMRRRCRVNDKALHVRDVRQQRENFQAVDELVRFLLPALDVEGEDGRAAVREIFLVQRMVRVFRQRR